MCNDWKYKDGALALRSTCQCQNMVWLKHVCPQDTELEKKPYSFFTSAPSAAARAAASAGTKAIARCYSYSSFRENSPFSTEKRSTAIILLQYCTTTTALGTLLHFVHFFIWPKNNNKTICVYWMHIRYPSIFFDQVGHKPKLWTTPSKFAKFIISKSFFSIKN